MKSTNHPQRPGPQEPRLGRRKLGSLEVSVASSEEARSVKATRIGSQPSIQGGL
jgi:hypothetical protein